MDLRRIVTILLRRWWLVLGMPALVLGISLVLLSTSPFVASMRASVLIPGDTQETGNAERPELMVLDDVTQLVNTYGFANAISAQLQQASPQYALSAEQIQSSLSADFYSRIVTIRATRNDEQEALALLDAVRLSFETQINYFLIGSGGQQATVRIVEPPTATRDSPATGTVALVIQTLVALAIGCGLAALAAAFDQRIHSRSDAATVVPVPVLGDLRTAQSPGSWWRVLARRSTPPPDQGTRSTQDVDRVAEADEPLRALRATLEATPSDPSSASLGRVWMFVGADGASSVSSALVQRLGHVSAAAGERCLVIDANQDRAIDADETALSAWLGSAVDGLPPLPVAGRNGGIELVEVRPLADGRDVMRGPRWDIVLSMARTAYDVILVGVRPVGSSADALALARQVGAIVLLVEVGRTGGSALVQARGELQAAGGTVAGTVLVPGD
jgi:capsular polysaccharide biosynthesis protein/Mrp family chromosome partitioning ATPase